MNGSVGPLTIAPPTTGETATTGAGAARSASARPGTARIGRIEITGFDGPTTIARAAAIASSAAAGGLAASTPSYSTPSTGPAPRSRIMNSWKSTHRPRARTRVRTGASAIGSTRAPTPSARAELGQRLGQRRALAQPLGPAQPDREIAVAEVEPHVDAELAQLVHRVEGVVAQAPAALVDAVGEPERDEVGVGRDVGPVHLDVVGGVDDDDEVLAHDVEQPARELRAAGAAGQDDDRRPHHSPVILIPAWVLWRTLIEIKSGVSASVIRAISRRAGMDGAQAVDPLHELGDDLAVGLAVAAQQDVLVEGVVEVGQQRRADRVQAAHDAHAVGDHLRRLLGGRALPDAEQPRRAAGDGGGERDGRVDQDLALAQDVLEVRQRLGLVAERHGEHDDLGLAGGLGVLGPGERPVRHRGLRAAGRLPRAVGVARADHDGHAGPPPAQGEPEAERTGGADDGDRGRQGRRV